jgi:hypothetical protein
MSIVGDFDVGKITRDPAQITRTHPFVGSLSNLGILGWCSPAAVCFFCSAAFWRDRKRRASASFLFFSGLLTTLLLLDDLFLFHEIVFPRYFHMPEKIVYVSYLAAVLVFLLAFRREILQTEYVVLVLAFGFFGLSILVDLFGAHIPDHLLLEDGCKFLGIVTWLIYFIRVCFQYLTLDASRRKRGSFS